MKPAHPLAPYLFIAPALAVFAFAIGVPMLFTVAFSFTDWNGLGAMKPIAFDNYVAALTDPIFRESFLPALGYIAGTLVLEVGLGLALAGIVSARRGTIWFRVAFFAPVMLPMVVVAILWSFVYNGDFGLLNATLGAVGLAPVQRIWLGDTSTALLAVSVVSGWVYAGFYMTIFYAAIRQIPHEVIQAARIDGVGEWALFRRVKVPMIRNALAIAVLLCVTGGFQGFDLFFVLTNGGPYGATEIPTTYLVKVVFRDGDVGYGSAMAVILTAIVLGIGFVYARLTRRYSAALAPAPAGMAVGPGGTA